MPTVLLADDSYVMRRPIKRALENCPDIELIAEAETYAETLRLAGELLPEVILLDMYMPDLNETSVADIRKALSNCRVLLMSVHATEEVLEFAEQLGVEALLDKAKLFDQLIPSITRQSDLSN